MKLVVHVSVFKPRPGIDARPTSLGLEAVCCKSAEGGMHSEDPHTGAHAHSHSPTHQHMHTRTHIHTQAQTHTCAQRQALYGWLAGWLGAGGALCSQPSPHQWFTLSQALAKIGEGLAPNEESCFSALVPMAKI